MGEVAFSLSNRTYWGVVVSYLEGELQLGVDASLKKISPQLISTRHGVQEGLTHPGFISSHLTHWSAPCLDINFLSDTCLLRCEAHIYERCWRGPSSLAS